MFAARFGQKFIEFVFSNNTSIPRLRYCSLKAIAMATRLRAMGLTPLLRLCHRNCISRTLCASAPARTSDNQINSKTASQSSRPSLCEHFSLLISAQEHRERQIKLSNTVCRKLQSQNQTSCLLLIPAAKRTYQADTKIPTLHFKQNSDFIYLTGFNSTLAADCVLAILGGTGEFRSILFAPKMTPHQVLWEGPGIKSEENLARLEVVCNDVVDIKLIKQFLAEHTSKRQVFATNCEFDPQLAAKSKDGTLSNENSVNQLSPFIDELRLIKSDSELRAMRRTCAIGAEAMKSTMSWTETQTELNSQLGLDIPLVNESQIGAKFDYEVRVNGACKLAYPSVVAGGHRSTIIHYGSNNKFLSPDDWLLMDAGCEDIEGYNSDITRSWQVGGNSARESKLHFALYQALVEVHQELIKTLEERMPTLDNLFSTMCLLLGRILVEFNVIPKSSSNSDCAKMGYKFCPHHVSHYLGLDVHDTPSISRNIPLKSGMVFTVEPGLYFHARDDVKKEFRGIGLRVEDDLCIDESGKVSVMTSGCPRLQVKSASQ